MSQAQVEKKVTDYLRQSQALEDYWQRRITTEQLQAEMDRMADHTKQPDVLQDLFEALGNDPFVIAECLARPVLSERLLGNFYADDQERLDSWRARAGTQAPVIMAVTTIPEPTVGHPPALPVRQAPDRNTRQSGPAVR
jgi:hypothetical protein